MLRSIAKLLRGQSDEITDLRKAVKKARVDALREAMRICYDRAEDAANRSMATKFDLVEEQACSGCGHRIRDLLDAEERNED